MQIKGAFVLGRSVPPFVLGRGVPPFVLGKVFLLLCWVGCSSFCAG